MLHARKDYNRRVQDNENIIGDDEPVFLLRAKNELMLPMLHQYLRLLRKNDNYDKHTEVGVLKHITRTKKWQLLNEPKAPDVPPKEVL